MQTGSEEELPTEDKEITAEQKREMTDMERTVRAARNASTPLLAIRTPDQAVTIRLLAKGFGPKNPLFGWDIVQGIFPISDQAEALMEELFGDQSPAIISARPTDAIEIARRLPKRSMVFMKNAHNYLTEDVRLRQAIWNLRDEFKFNRRTLILLGPDFSLTTDLVNDIVMIDEELPNTEEVEDLVKSAFADTNLSTPDDDLLRRAVDAVIGLPSYPAEQALAMSFTPAVKDGGVIVQEPYLDIQELWERKRRIIEEVDGLQVHRGKETFADIGGSENLKQFLSDYLNGNKPTRLVVFIDEIEKGLGGGGAREGGGGEVERGMLGTLLSEMEDREYTGAILVGPPGCNKSLTAKAMGNTARVPTVQFDLNGMKNSLVGESEANMRAALKILRSMGQGNCFFIATCNSIAGLPPELRRRFDAGTFFCDLPDKSERELIWTIHRAKFNINPDFDTPNDTDWTGAEIRNCCRLAWMLNKELKEAAQYIVPVAVAARDVIARLRQEADGAYISASHPGTYVYQALVTEADSPSKKRRKIQNMLSDD